MDIKELTEKLQEALREEHMVTVYYDKQWVNSYTIHPLADGIDPTKLEAVIETTGNQGDKYDGTEYKP